MARIPYSPSDDLRLMANPRITTDTRIPDTRTGGEAIGAAMRNLGGSISGLGSKLQAQQDRADAAAASTVRFENSVLAYEYGQNASANTLDTVRNNPDHTGRTLTQAGVQNLNALTDPINKRVEELRATGKPEMIDEANRLALKIRKINDRQLLAYEGAAFATERKYRSDKVNEMATGAAEAVTGDEATSDAHLATLDEAIDGLEGFYTPYEIEEMKKKVRANILAVESVKKHGGDVIGYKRENNIPLTWKEQFQEMAIDKEGFEETPYWDVDGWRIGYGSSTFTSADGKTVVDLSKISRDPRVKPNVRISREQAELDLRRRTDEYAGNAMRIMGQEAWNRLNDTQKAAVTDLMYNGTGNDQVRAALRTGDPTAIANAMRAYEHPDPRYREGLKQRWNQRADMLETGQQAESLVRRLPQQNFQNFQLGSNIKWTPGAKRRQPPDPVLADKLSEAAFRVYGPGYTIHIYSAGQSPKGAKGSRTGSTRHDHGRAADVYVLDPDGNKVTDDRMLSKLGQYWLATKQGSFGAEMRGGGLHLDLHTDRANNWNYASKGGRYTAAYQNAVTQGIAGQLPEGMYQPGFIVRAERPYTNVPTRQANPRYDVVPQTARVEGLKQVVAAQNEQMAGLVASITQGYQSKIAEYEQSINDNKMGFDIQSMLADSSIMPDDLEALAKHYEKVTEDDRLSKGVEQVLSGGGNISDVVTEMTAAGHTEAKAKSVAQGVVNEQWSNPEEWTSGGFVRAAQSTGMVPDGYTAHLNELMSRGDVETLSRFLPGLTEIVKTNPQAIKDDGLKRLASRADELARLRFGEGEANKYLSDIMRPRTADEKKRYRDAADENIKNTKHETSKATWALEQLGASDDDLPAADPRRARFNDDYQDLYRTYMEMYDGNDAYASQMAAQHMSKLWNYSTAGGGSPRFQYLPPDQTYAKVFDGETQGGSTAYLGWLVKRQVDIEMKRENLMTPDGRQVQVVPGSVQFMAIPQTLRESSQGKSNPGYKVVVSTTDGRMMSFGMKPTAAELLYVNRLAAQHAANGTTPPWAPSAAAYDPADPATSIREYREGLPGATAPEGDPFDEETALERAIPIVREEFRKIPGYALEGLRRSPMGTVIEMQERVLEGVSEGVGRRVQQFEPAPQEEMQRRLRESEQGTNVRPYRPRIPSPLDGN